jgi:hypothetical protein
VPPSAQRTIKSIVDTASLVIMSSPSTKFGAHASEAIQEVLSNQALLSEYLPNFNCP